MCLQNRRAAERAKDELNGALLHELDLKIGWGKAVVIPPIPMYTSSGHGGLAPMLAAARAAAQAPAPGQHAATPWGKGEKDDGVHKGVGERAERRATSGTSQLTLTVHLDL